MHTSAPPDPDPRTTSRPLTNRFRPDFKRAMLFGAAALAVASAVHQYEDLSWNSPVEALAVIASAAAFVALAVLTVRSAAIEVANVSRVRFGDAHANVVGLLVTLGGYALTAFAMLAVLGVSPARLLVSGAVTGVILGVAAQQSLGNVVAGIVLLLNRPFQVGHDITVRSGALAGPYSGRVVSIGLTYVHLQTSDGLVLLPNSGVLAAAVGPTLRPQRRDRHDASSSLATDERGGSSAPQE
ncbi:MAG: small-conductance mechanosensitive channel-like protein [Frankiales bacterium]|nr:small-conductance mechanosensitive channel-like protein [Frankiales bacterium]